MDSQGNLYVVGWVHRVTQSGSGKNRTTLTERFWIVRKGSSGGTQWTTLDVFTLGRQPFSSNGVDYYGASSWANAVTVDSNDTVHVTGAGIGPEVNLHHWVTRSLAVGSGGWTLHEFVRLPGLTTSQGRDIAADAAGNLYSCGISEGGPDGAHRWIVRRALAAAP